MGNVSYNDAIDCGQAERCSMCGAVLHGDEPAQEQDIRIEVLYRFAERILWDRMSSKACGTMLKIMCAATLLPSASTRQIGAAVGISHARVAQAQAWMKQNLPSIHSALWRDR